MSDNDYILITKKHVLWCVVIVAVVVAAIMAGYNAHRAKAERDYEMHNFGIRMEWFDERYTHGFRAGSKPLEEAWLEYRDKGYNGITDPVVIRSIRQWQEEGIAGWTNVDEDDLNIIMDRIENRKRVDGSNFYSEQVIEDARMLFFGGYDILGETDMLRFLTAIDAININRRDTSFTGVDRGTWMNFE